MIKYKLVILFLSIIGIGFTQKVSPSVSVQQKQNNVAGKSNKLKKANSIKGNATTLPKGRIEGIRKESVIHEINEN